MGGLNRGGGEGKGVPRGKIRTPAKWDTLLSLSHTHSHLLTASIDVALADTRKAAAKKKEKSRHVTLRCTT